MKLFIASEHLYGILQKMANPNERSLNAPNPNANSTYTGWLVTGGTSGKGVILREKRSRKYRIKIFRLKLCFRENRLRKCS